MRETFTSGSVGRAPGNRCLYPEPDCLQRPVRRSSLCNIPIADGKDSEDILGSAAYLNPKGQGNKSMPTKPGTAEDAETVARRDPRDMAKAILLEVQCPSVNGGPLATASKRQVDSSHRQADGLGDFESPAPPNEGGDGMSGPPTSR